MPDNTAEQAIYNRLASAPTFHPTTASLFADDWSLEPGDIVAVQSGENTYNVPVYGYALEWNGNSMVQIQSTGNQQRKPLSALKRRQFASGRRSYNNKKTIEEQGVTYTAHFEQTDRRVSSTLSATGVLLDADGYPVMVLNPETGEYEYAFDTTGTGATLSSRVIQTAGELKSEVTARTRQGETFSSQISQMANKISLVVTGEGQNAQVSRAAILLAINGSGGSDAVIEADNIDLRGLVTAQEFQTETGRIDALYAGTAQVEGIYSKNNIMALGWIVAGSYVNATDLQIEGTSLKPAVTDLQVVLSGNTYTLQKKTAQSSQNWTDVGTFSRATTLTDEWRGSEGSQVLVVTATPQGNEYTYTPTMRLQAASPVSTSFTAELVTLNEMAQATVRRSLNGYLVAGTVPGSTTPCVNVCRSSDGSGVIATFPISGQAPTSIVRESYSTTAKTVTVKATDGTTDILTGQVISAEEIYNAGWHNAYGKISLPSAQTSSATMTVRLPGATQDTPSGLGNPYPFTVSCDDAYCYIKDEDDAVVARSTNGAYINGQMAVNVTASGWDWDSTNSRYYNRVSGSSPNTSSVDVLVPALSVEVGTAGFSTSTYKANIYAYGPTVSGSRHAIQTIQADASILRPNWVAIGAGAGEKGHLDANGNTVTERTNDSNHSYHIETRGTGSAGTNANVFMVIHGYVRNADNTLLWNSNTQDKNIVMNAPITGVYKEGYVDGYGNGRTAILNALSVRAGGWTWDSEEEEFYNSVTAYNGNSATSAVTTLSLPQITSSASIVYNASRHEYAYNSSATSGGHAIASSAAQWSGTQAYEDGWAAATGKVVWPSAGTTAGFIVKAPSSTVGSDLSKSFTLSADGWTDNSSKNTINVYMGGTTVATTTINAPSVSGTLTTASSLPSGKTATTLRSGYLYKLEVKRGGTTISTTYYRCP